MEGGDGGSYTYDGSYSLNWSQTSLEESIMQSLTFNDFADSGGVNIQYVEGSGGEDPKVQSLSAVPLRPISPGIFFEGLQAGRGALYRSAWRSQTTDGVPYLEPVAVAPGISGPVGRVLTDEAAFYSNYASFFTSAGYNSTYYASQRQTRQSGFTSSNMSGAINTTLAVPPAFDDTISADYAMDYYYSYTDTYWNEHYLNDYTRALLGFSQRHAWDFSTATFTSAGTYCAEGDVESSVIGCLDFDISLTWDNDASGDYNYCRSRPNPIDCYGQPDEGLMTLQAGGATASFAYTPGGTVFTLDAGDGSAIFETNLPPVFVGPF